MAHLSYNEFKALTGKTSVTDWVKYNWISPQDSASKRYWVFKYTSYDEQQILNPDGTTTSLKTACTKSIRESRLLFLKPNQYALADALSFNKQTYTHEGVTHAISNTDYILSEVDESIWDDSKTLLENYSAQAEKDYTQESYASQAKAINKYIEVQELTEEQVAAMYKLKDILP